MASIRKRGNSYLLVVSMATTRGSPPQAPAKTVHPPEAHPKAKEKWLEEEAASSSGSAKTSP